MIRFSVDNNCIIIETQFFRSVPDFLDDRTRCIILLNFKSLIQQKLFNLHRSSKGRDKDDVILSQFRPWNKLMAVCIHYEFYAPALKVVIYFLVMDHLA